MQRSKGECTTGGQTTSGKCEVNVQLHPSNAIIMIVKVKTPRQLTKPCHNGFKKSPGESNWFRVKMLKRNFTNPRRFALTPGRKIVNIKFHTIVFFGHFCFENIHSTINKKTSVPLKKFVLVFKQLNYFSLTKPLDYLGWGRVRSL